MTTKNPNANVNSRNNEITIQIIIYFARDIPSNDSILLYTTITNNTRSM